MTTPGKTRLSSDSEEDAVIDTTQKSACTPKTGKVRCISRTGFHEIAYRDWGSSRSKSNIVCVHGLTRNNRDFDNLAQRLSHLHRVVCPDLVGRGESDWLNDPTDYNLFQYNIDLTVLLARMNIDDHTWIGSSLGGLMGISLAGIERSPIKRLIVNDIGPNVPFSAISRVTNYAGVVTEFETLKKVEHHLRSILAPFGPMTDRDWAKMARTSSFKSGSTYLLRSDPEIMQNFRRYWMFSHFSLWKQWERIKCPVLILRGTESDFLPNSLLDRMLDRQSRAEAIEFDGVGHTPTLNAAEQIDPICEWLDRTTF
ncbi:alpha/beta fold hydrolase [Ruegeria hyattellae]|uniref:alpha/beta fold hydrolase n=1 Tax=Ruegeria hyattellae TaxID=3233337 RepID=UPI00355C1C5D